MPYRSVADLPEAQVDQYSTHQKHAFLEAFNNAFEEYGRRGSRLRDGPRRSQRAPERESDRRREDARGSPARLSAAPAGRLAAEPRQQRDPRRLEDEPRRERLVDRVARATYVSQRA